MKYFAEFNTDGERTAGYIADGMPHTEADIRQLYPDAVEVSVADQELYVTGQYIRNQDGRPIERPVSLDDLKLTKLQQIDAWTAQAITGGFVSVAAGAPHKYGSEEVDQKNLLLMLQAAETDGFGDHPIYQGSIPVRAVPQNKSTKVVLPHSAAQMQVLVADLAAHTSYCKQVGWQLQRAVDEAQTAEELAVIVWPEQAVQTYLDPVSKSWWRRLF